MRARRRGTISVAIGALEKAVELSEDRTSQAQRLLDAAEVVFELGCRELALRFVAEAELIGLGAVDRQHVILIQDTFDTGEDTVGVEQVIEVAQRTWHRDANLALNILRRAAGKSWWIGRSEDRRELLVAAVERLGIAEDDPQRLAILALVGSTRRVTNVLEHLSRPASETDADPVAARLLGLAAYAVGHFEFAIDALTVAMAGLCQQGQRLVPLRTRRSAGGPRKALSCALPSSGSIQYETGEAVDALCVSERPVLGHLLESLAFGRVQQLLAGSQKLHARNAVPARARDPAHRHVDDRPLAGQVGETVA